MKTLELTEEQIGLLFTALYEKQMETKRYLSDWDAPEVPEERHTCCAFHRLRYEQHRDMISSLTARKTAEDELLQLLEEVSK